jgi:CreA protein
MSHERQSEAADDGFRRSRPAARPASEFRWQHRHFPGLDPPAHRAWRTVADHTILHGSRAISSGLRRKAMMRMVGALLVAVGAGLGALGLGWAAAEEVGEVSTVFHFLSPDHKIVLEAFDDPKIAGVTCYLARADAGGFKSMIGVEEDPSDASITCRQVGPIKVQDELEEGEEVFKKRTSLIFKSMQVVRFFDAKRKVFLYLVYSDRVIEGSPKNSVSAVPAMAWAGEAPVLPAVED